MATSKEMLEPEERANELYWGSTSSVNQIAEALDLSKSALYGLIRPLPGDRGCPLCSAELVYAHRTARDRGQLSCLECGWQGTEDEAPAGDGEGAVMLPVHDEVDAVGPSPEDRHRTRTLLGGAFLGAAVGLALVIWTRRR